MNRQKSLIAGFFLILIIIAGVAYAELAGPHNAANNIGCFNYCHIIPEVKSPYWDHSPSNIDDTPTNYLCNSCHTTVSGPYSTINAPKAMTHSSLNTDDDYGNWTTECTDCHNPHYQEQLQWLVYGEAETNVFIATGSITDYTYNGGTGETTLDFDTDISYKTGWDAAKLVKKTIDYRRTLLIPDTSALTPDTTDNLSYQIVAVDEGAKTITVKGDASEILDNVTLPSSFGIIYGQLIREYIKRDGALKRAKMFDSTAGGTGGLTDQSGAFYPVGICQVCHTQTTHWSPTALAGGDVHFPDRSCSDCHDHANGFGHGSGGGTNCEACHGHDNGYEYSAGEYSQGVGTTYSHSTHTENDTDDLKGPTLACPACHDTSNFPYFTSGTDGNGDGNFSLSETDVCDTCHSPLGTYDGVDDAVVGAKSIWTDGAYDHAGGNPHTLQTGKEKWCATCHDEVASVISSVTAPNVAGDESGAYTYGNGWGYYKTGHGLSTDNAFPSSGGVANGAGLECNGCHDFGMSHIDGNARTYAAGSDDGGNAYRAGFRLVQIDLGGGPINPMRLPFPDISTIQDHFALCASCHDPDPFLNSGSTNTNLRYNGTNHHSYHMSQGHAMQGRYDSDWSGGGDSRVNCTLCHNVHGSQRLAMMRDGSLVSRNGFDIWYGNPAIVDNVSSNLTAPEPQNLTLIQSTGIIMSEWSSTTVCSACHNRNYTSYYPRGTLYWVGDVPALDWTMEEYYVNRGIHTDRIFNTTDDVHFRVMYFDPNNDAPSTIEVWIDHNDNGTYEGGEVMSMVEDDPADTTYSDGKIYKATVSVTDPGDKALIYRVYASDGTNDAVGQPAQNQTIEWDNNFIRDVPTEYASLQAAIEEAYDGNTIIVGDGTYSENIDYNGKDLIIRSVNGAAATTISGSGSDNPAVSFDNGETSAAILDGFTIDNVDTGTYYNMRGISISNSATPVIKNSIITGNSMRGKGAGILIDGGAATIENCTIDSNSSSYETGGGIHVANGMAPTTITNSSISGNTSKIAGGGLYVANSDIVLTNVTMNSNRSNESAGGGAYFTGDVDAVISGGSISSNTSKYSGGGLYFNGGGAGNLSISGATINSNVNNTTSTSNGGGLYLSNIGTTTTITNTSISSNDCKNGGGGIYATGAPLSLTGCTINGNDASNTDGGGIWTNTSMTITDSNITNNTTSHTPEDGGGIYGTGASTVFTITNTHVDNNQSNNGAGIAFWGQQLNFTGGSINGNVSPGQYTGGGLKTSAPVTMYGTEVIGNSSGNGGAGISCTNTLTITNSIVANNNGGSYYWASGGGISASTIIMMNSTVVGNVASWGGGVNAGGNATNSISWNNYSYRESSTRNFRGNPTVSFTDTAGGGYVNGGDNISIDPLFVNERPYGESPTTTGDYHLQNASPCKEQATSTGAPTDDIDGDSRPSGAGHDIGADEYIPTSVPVAPTIGTPSALTSTSIRWNFTDNANDEDGFKTHDTSHTVKVSSATPDLTSLDETGLLPNTQYTRHVHAYNGVGDSTDSADASKYTLAEPPTLPAATDGTYADRINVSWTTSASASHYHVYRDGVSGVGTLVYNSTGTSFDDIIADAHTYYIYSVNVDDVNSSSYINDNGFTSGDSNPPSASNINPATGATGINVDSDLTLTLSDSGSGVDWTTFDITLNGTKGYSRHYTHIDTSMVTKTGTLTSYDVTINPDAVFATNELITVTVTVSDLAGNAMSAPTWSFTTGNVPSGAVSYWRFDENSGTTAADSTGNNDGTVNGASWTTGQSDSALNFDGNDYVRVANDSTLQFGSGSFTVEAWIYPVSVDNVRIANNRGTGAGGSYKGWQFKITDGGGSNWYFNDTSIDDATGAYMACNSCGSSYSKNDWYHVAMIYDADNELRLYVNGNLDGTIAVGNYGDISNGLPIAIGAAIADNGTEGTYAQYFNGKIDEVVIYNRALTAPEVLNRYNAGGP